MVKIDGIAVNCPGALLKVDYGFRPWSGVTLIKKGKCIVQNCDAKCRFNPHDGETILRDANNEALIVKPTLAQWGEIISDVAAERGVVCLKCHSPINANCFEGYDHDQGLPVEGKAERQWVYHKCDCGYEYAFHYLLR